MKKKTMYENIIAIRNVLKKKTTQFQPAQYLKKLAKIILKPKNLKKKRNKKKKKKSILGKKKAKKNMYKKKTCYSKDPTRFRVL